MLIKQDDSGVNGSASSQKWPCSFLGLNCRLKQFQCVPLHGRCWPKQGADFIKCCTESTNSVKITLFSTSTYVVNPSPHPKEFDCVHNDDRIVSHRHIIWNNHNVQRCIVDDTAPPYLSELLHLYSPSRSLRLASDLPSS